MFQLLSTMLYGRPLQIFQQQPPIMNEPHPNSYQSDARRILTHAKLFKILLAGYRTCLGCVYRVFALMTPKMYSDLKFFKQLGEQILSSQQMEASNNLSQIDKVFSQIVSDCQAHFSKSFTCWLCTGILQTPFLDNLSVRISKQIITEFYENKSKFKLNVKVDTLITIKYLVFLHMLPFELRKTYGLTEQEVQWIVKDVIKSQVDRNGALDIKTVFKWVLSNSINQLQNFKLTSTINEDQNTVIVSLEVDHKSKYLEEMLSGMLGPLMHFAGVQSKPNKNANKNKKVKIDLTDCTYGIKWNSNIVNRLFMITSQEWEEFSVKNPCASLQELQENPYNHSMEEEQKLNKNEYWKLLIKTKIELMNQHIYLCGRYVKFSRYLSQTPWIINKQRLTESSLQEEVQKQILRFFYPEEIPEEAIEVKFHAGGREDIDVRMLKGGRPFVIEFVNPRSNFTELTIERIMEKIKTKLPHLVGNLGQIKADGLTAEQLQRTKMNLLQFLINNSTQLAKVYNFSKTTASFISNQLKQAESEKIKHYVCYIKSETEFEEGDKEILEKHQNMTIVQKTPLRVLHRRTLMYRNKVIHKIIYHPVSKFSAVLEIWASAGTYIKQFVHGDMNRTLPNVGSMLNKSVDILQLDVGSLKEGEWEEGACEEMRLGELPWQKRD